MGGGGSHPFLSAVSSQSLLTTSVFYHLRKSTRGPQKYPNVFNHLQTTSPVTTCVFYHLRKTSRVPQKYPNVFYHLQTTTPVTTCVFYHLRKKPGGGGSRSLPPDAFCRDGGCLLLNLSFPLREKLLGFRKFFDPTLSRRTSCVTVSQ
jgi:hypothetical protein